jgi:hypothetical protein
MGGTWPPGPPVVAANRDGALSAFLIGEDTALYRYDQAGPNGTWGIAQSMGGTWPRSRYIAAAHVAAAARYCARWHQLRPAAATAGRSCPGH